MFKCTFEQNNVITNIRNIVINNTITFVINKYRKRILFTCLSLFCLAWSEGVSCKTCVNCQEALNWCVAARRTEAPSWVGFSGSIAQLLPRCFHILFFISTFVYARCDFVGTKSNLRQPSCRRYSLCSHILYWLLWKGQTKQSSSKWGLRRRKNALS